MQKPKGTLDYFGENADFLRFITQILETIFINNGGCFLETPVFELRDTLMGKYGEEAETKLIYEIKENGGAPLALRYDLTVPLMRFIKENGIDQMRRYSIGKVYRRDNPNTTQGRFREFYQADFDIIGEQSMDGHAEMLILMMVSEIFNSLSVKFKILLNCTNELRHNIVDKVGVPSEQFKTICSSIDKLDKVAWKDIHFELVEKGMTLTQVDQLKEVLSQKSSPPLWAQLLSVYGLDNIIEWTPSLARGLDYYCGMIFEVKVDGASMSVAAGGRYDGLVGKSAIGFSVGITRLMSLIKIKQRDNQWKEAYYLTTLGNIDSSIKARVITYCLKNIVADRPFTWSFGKDKKLTKVITEKAKDNIKYIIIIAENEIKSGKLILKNLENCSQDIIVMES